MVPNFDARIILLLCTLMQGLAGLRLNKVSIPAYKLRGESVFLECQYELDGPKHGTSSNSRHPHNQHGAVGSDLNYVDADVLTATQELPVFRRMRTHPYSQRHRQQHPQQQRQKSYHYFQSDDAGSEAASISGGGFYQTPHQPKPSALNARKRDAYQDPLTGVRLYEGGRRVYTGTYDSRGQSGGKAFNGGDIERDASLSGNESDELNSEGGVGRDEDGNEEGEALYAVKWYKDNEEFYRFVPKANPPKQSYRVDGVRVIEEHSDSSRVLLRGLTLNSTGLYRCEVSAEAPNFSSVQAEGRMDIVYLPRDGPHIKGQQFQYQIGETLNLNCTSGKSHPASHLQWFINEQPMLDGNFLVRYNDTVHKHGLITSTLGLQLTVDGRHFFNGAMKVKCLASISPVLWKGGKESVLQRRPGIIDNREAMLLVRSTARGLQQSLEVVTLIVLLCKLSQFLLQTSLR